MPTLAKCFIVAFLAFILWCVPVALIWALNTVFGLAVPVTFKTWLAVFILSAPFWPIVASSRK